MSNVTLSTNTILENVFGVIIKACFEAATELAANNQIEEAPKKTRGTRTSNATTKGKKDSFLIPGETKVIPEEDKIVKSSSKTPRKKNKEIESRTERRKTFVKNMSNAFGGAMTDKQVAAAMGTCVATVVRYKKEIKSEIGKYEDLK